MHANLHALKYVCTWIHVARGREDPSCIGKMGKYKSVPHVNVICLPQTYHLLLNSIDLIGDINRHAVFISMEVNRYKDFNWNEYFMTH